MKNYKQIIEKNKCNLQENHTYKNFREICDALLLYTNKGEKREYPSGTSKKAIQNILPCYCYIERIKDTQKYHIGKIYDTPLPLPQSKNIKISPYAQLLYPQIIYMLYQEQNNSNYTSIRNTQSSLMTEFGFDNNLLKNPIIGYHWLPDNERAFRALLINDIKDISLPICLQCFNRAMKNFNKTNKLVCEKKHYIAFEKDNKYYERLADDNEESIISNELTKIKNNNASRKYDLLFRNYYNETIYDELNKALMQYGFVTTSTVWDIKLPNTSEYNITQLYNQIFGSMDSKQTSEFLNKQKKQVNSRIVQQVKNQIPLLTVGAVRNVNNDYIREKCEKINHYMDNNFPMPQYTWDEQVDILHKNYYSLINEYLAL